MAWQNEESKPVRIDSMESQDLKISRSDRFDLQRKIVSHMTSASWQNIPHVSYLYEPDITDFYEEFIRLGVQWRDEGKKITFNTLILKVVSQGLLSATDLNAHLEFNYKKARGILHTMEKINIAVPWILPDGKMITPVIRDTNDMTLTDISDAITDLGRRIANTDINEMLYQAVKADTLAELRKFNLGVIKRVLANISGKHGISGLRGQSRDDYYSVTETDRLSEKNLVSATVTVSNVGSLYKEQRGFFGLLEIIPPQVFAVGLGAVQEKPGVFVAAQGKKEIGIRKTLPMCLAFDHRAVDFSSIVPFLKKLDEIFASPELIARW